MEISPIAELLERYKKRYFRGSEQKEETIAIIERLTGMNIGKQSIEIKNGCITTQLHPVEKNELFLKKKAIIDECATHNITITDIR